MQCPRRVPGKHGPGVEAPWVGRGPPGVASHGAGGGGGHLAPALAAVAAVAASPRGRLAG